MTNRENEPICQGGRGKALSVSFHGPYAVLFTIAKAVGVRLDTGVDMNGSSVVIKDVTPAEMSLISKILSERS